MLEVRSRTNPEIESMKWSTLTPQKNVLKSTQKKPATEAPFAAENVHPPAPDAKAVQRHVYTFPYEVLPAPWFEHPNPQVGASRSPSKKPLASAPPRARYKSCTLLQPTCASPRAHIGSSRLQSGQGYRAMTCITVLVSSAVPLPFFLGRRGIPFFASCSCHITVLP